MIKNLILTGSSYRTDKQMAVTASEFKEDEIVILDLSKGLNRRRKFMFNECDKNTKLIVFKEVRSNFDPVRFMVMTHGINVDKKHYKPFAINPHIMIVCDEDFNPEDITPLGASFTRRFHHINCNISTC